MPTESVVLRPGPMRIAAVAALAGFSEAVTYPTVTDGCGKVWKAPSALLIAVAIAGGESSGHAWVFRVDSDRSTDFGLWEINNADRPDFFGPVLNPLALNWAMIQDNAVMAYKIYQEAIRIRTVDKLPLTADWQPWHAYSGGGYKAARYGGRSWLEWANSGITQMHADLPGVAGATTAIKLAKLASIDNDPLAYWETVSEG